MILPIAFLISLLFGQLGAVSPAPGIYIYAHDIILGILVISFLLRARNFQFSIFPAKRDPATRDNFQLLAPIVAFIGASILSVIANAYRLEQATILRGFLYIARWGFYSTLVVIIASSKRQTLWLSGLYFTGVGFAVIGIIQFFLYPSLRNLLYLGWDPHYYRVFSTLLDPNFTGIILVLTLFLGIAVKPQLGRPFIAKIISGIVGIAFVLTFSRSSILALLAGLAVWIVAKRKWNIVWIAVILLGIYIVMPKPGGDTLRIFRPESTMARISNWQESVRLIATSPIAGHGFYALPQPDVSATSRAVAYLDSSLLFVFATTGVIGFVSFIWLLKSMERTFAKAKEKHMRHIRIVGYMSLAGLLVHSMFVNSLFYAWVMIWMWMLVGAASRDPSTSSG